MLVKLWRFIENYCGIESLLVRSSGGQYDQYHSFIHSLALFALAFKHNLWVTSFEDFLKSDSFDKDDVKQMINLIKPLVCNLVEDKVKMRKSGKAQQVSFLDEFVLSVSSGLLRLLHEYFAMQDFIDPSEWDLTHINWKKVLKEPALLQQDQMILVIWYMPECIPFDVRAMFFTNRVKADQALQSDKKHPVKIRRSAIWEDGYHSLSKIQNLKECVYVIFLNESGQAEEGVDAGGLFKEFLTNLIDTVFNPNYGIFLQTENEKQLYPNAQSHHLFAHGEDARVFHFLGRILGKAMYDGITVEP